MRTRLSDLAAGVAQDSCLAALAVVPAFFNVYSEVTFEPDKALLLRTLAGVALAAIIVRCVESGFATWRVEGGPLWRAPLVLPVLALTAAHLLAATFSIAPDLSLWGSYLRRQGICTWLAYLAVFLTLRLVVRGGAQVERLATVILLASIAPAAYGVLQSVGLDPIDWGKAEATRRVTSTAGNPIFLGAFLIIVVPLALARLLEAATRASARSVSSPATGRWKALPYALLLVLQLLAIFYTQSRGPVLGLVFGVAAFAAAAAVVARARWPVYTFAVGALLAIAVVAVWSRGEDRVLGRLARLNPEAGSERVRVLIWDNLVGLLLDRPARAAIGYGPDTLLLAFNPVYPAELAGLEGGELSPDRAHNEILDAAASTGVIGCVAELALFLAVFTHALRGLGAIATARAHAVFLAIVVGAGLVAAAGSIVLTGGRTLVGLCLGLGMAVGVLGYTARAALRRSGIEADAAGARRFLLAGVFAGMVAHFVEIQVGIATVTTRLYFFAAAALVTLLCEPAARTAGAGEVESDTAGGTLGIITGLIAIVMTFGLYTPNTGAPTAATTVAALLASIWLLSAAVVAAGAPREATLRQSMYAAGAHAAWSLGIWGSFAAGYVPWVRSLAAAAAGGATYVAPRLASTVIVTYLALFIGLALMSHRRARRRGEAAGAVAGRRSSAPPVASRYGSLATVVMLAAAALNAVASLQAERADCFAKLGKTYEHANRWMNAVAAHEWAVDLVPGREEYAVNLGRALIERARRSVANSAQRDADAARAVHLTEALVQAHPFNPDHPANLARIYRKWGRLGNADERAQRFAHAEAAYQTALALKPQNPLLLNEMAVLELERGHLDASVALYARSLQLHDRLPRTYALRAQVLRLLGRTEEATADYRQARQLCGRGEDCQWSLGEVYVRTDQLDAALVEAESARVSVGGREGRVLERFIALLNRIRSSRPPTASGH